MKLSWNTMEKDDIEFVAKHLEAINKINIQRVQTMQIPSKLLGTNTTGAKAQGIKVDRAIAQGLRTDLIIVDDPLGDSEKEEKNKILLEFHAEQNYNWMLNTILFESITHDHSGAISLLNHVMGFKDIMFRAYDIETGLYLCSCNSYRATKTRYI
jgi:ABC-type proline/glycine betaine transport system ATPase subunit